jgi:DNA-binding response OmpR family regulator
MGAKVLIVDDDATASAGLAALLSDAGYAPHCVTTFQQGQTALSREIPDLMIVDVRLGDFNGLQLIIDSDARIPAIVVTGFSDSTLQAEASKLGAEFVVKPIRPSALLALVQRKLAAR